MWDVPDMTNSLYVMYVWCLPLGQGKEAVLTKFTHHGKTRARAFCWQKPRVKPPWALGP